MIGIFQISSINLEFVTTDSNSTVGYDDTFCTKTTIIWLQQQGNPDYLFTNFLLLKKKCVGWRWFDSMCSQGLLWKLVNIIEKSNYLCFCGNSLTTQTRRQTGVRWLKRRGIMQKCSGVHLGIVKWKLTFYLCLSPTHWNFPNRTFPTENHSIKVESDQWQGVEEANTKHIMISSELRFHVNLREPRSQSTFTV